MNITTHIACLLFVSLSFSVTAATMIDSTDQEGISSRIYIDKNKARFEMPENEGYIVIDINKSSMHLISHPQRMVIDMSQTLTASKASSTGKQPNVQFKPKGKGPSIAGYATTEYEEYVNGQYCGSLFASTQAARDLGISKFINSFNIMMSEMNNMYSDMAGDIMNDCESADVISGHKINEIGFPLKSFDSNREMDMVVTRIDKNASLPANAFSVPGNYKVTTMQAFMQDAMNQAVPEELKEMMKNVTPENMDKIHQQMMESIPEEMREMIKKQMQEQ